ncbi:MAG: hypothetical protein GKS00_01755 [Alphaproteobacteria bacterium]|nr:hypothetical protein [Alphaproteobacteria bacterium]
MTDTAGEGTPKSAFNFIRGVEGDTGECEWPDGAEQVRQALQVQIAGATDNNGMGGGQQQ